MQEECLSLLALGINCSSCCTATQRRRLGPHLMRNCIQLELQGNLAWQKAVTQFQTWLGCRAALWSKVQLEWPGKGRDRDGEIPTGSEDTRGEGAERPRLKVTNPANRPTGQTWGFTSPSRGAGVQLPFLKKTTIPSNSGAGVRIRQRGFRKGSNSFEFPEKWP